MLSNVDHGNIRSESTQLITEEEVVGSEDGCANLREHDYIGLSTISSSSASTTTTQTQSDLFIANAHGNGEELECGDTELRLGIGPISKCDVSLAVPYASNTHHNIGHRQLQQGMSIDAATEFHQSFWPWAAPGRFMIPVPKISTVPAKRSYMDIARKGGNNNPCTCTLSINPIALSEASSHFAVSASVPQNSVVASSAYGGLYTWTQVNCSSASNGQHACPSSDIGSSYANNSAFANRSITLPPVVKPHIAPLASLHNPPLLSTPPSTVTPLHSSPLSEDRVFLPHNRQDDARTPKASVVGWPPVRTFRKNTLHSAVGPWANKQSNTSPDPQKHEDGHLNTAEVVGEVTKGSSKDAIYVKAKLDGVRICRKVDLTSYNNYDSLKSALQDMFQGFVCSDNAKLDLLQGKSYVLTHEDKDGDWMLVGDVPWHMFVTTVKSFRIMKASDAAGLGEKVFAKLKAQDMA